MPVPTLWAHKLNEWQTCLWCSMCFGLILVLSSNDNFFYKCNSFFVDKKVRCDYCSSNEERFLQPGKY